MAQKIRENLSINVIMAASLFLAACAVLYIVEYVMYGWAVGAMFVYASIYPPLIMILYFAFGKRRPVREETSQQRKETKAAIAYIVLASYAAFTYYYVLTSRHVRLGSLQMLGIVTAIVIVAIMHKLRRKEADIKFKANAVSIIYLAILLATVIFLLITDSYTITGARRVLEDNGYNNTSFVSHHPAETEDIPVNAGRLGAYSFQSDTGSETIYVDVAAGEIIPANSD